MSAPVEDVKNAQLSNGGNNSASTGSDNGGEQAKLNTVVLTSTSTVATLDPSVAEAQRKAEDARFTARASVILSCVMTPLVYGAYIWGKVNNLDLAPPDWVLGVIFTPFGGGAYVWLRHAIEQKKAEDSRK